MQTDHTIHQGWGDHIEWVNPDEFATKSMETDTFRVYGHMPTIPKAGETLLAEMKLSFVKFEFVEVERCTDPPDMFFGTVKAVEQKLKEAADEVS